MSRDNPHNLEVEAALLGVMLQEREAREIGLALLPEHFILPFHAKVHRAIARCHEESPAGVDLVGIAAHLDGLGTASLLKLTQATPLLPNPERYVAIITERARLRAVAAYAGQLSEAALGGKTETVDQLLAAAETRLAPALTGQIDTIELLDLLEQPDPIAKPWVLPGLLRAGENLVLTGGEGAGKMRTLRDFALGVASGVHPFTDLPMRRQQVLIVDLQEDATELRGELAIQHRHLAKHYRKGMIQMVTRRAGIDLLTANDARWFEALIAKVQPALVIMGPLKKLYRAPVGKGIWDDDVVEGLHRRFDEWQARYGFAMCLEGHAGHDRETWRVKGSSAWYAWPHFGYGLNPVTWRPREVEMIRWRGDRENGVKRYWPSRLSESRCGWSWTADTVAVEELRRVQQAGDPVEQPAFETEEPF